MSHSTSIVATPITFDQVRSIDRAQQAWEDDEEGKCSISQAPKYLTPISIQDLIQHNASLMKLSAEQAQETLKERCIVYEVDRKLAEHFPLLGVGTEAIVFDMGTCVLKRRVCGARMWESDFRRFAQECPGLFSEQVPLYGPLISVTRPNGRVELVDGNNPHNNDYELQVQEKLSPVDPAKYLEKIRTFYYPNSDPATFGQPTKWGSAQFLCWEWGLDKQGVPHVYDWG